MHSCRSFLEGVKFADAMASDLTDEQYLEEIKAGLHIAYCRSRAQAARARVEQLQQQIGSLSGVQPGGGLPGGVFRCGTWCAQVSLLKLVNLFRAYQRLPWASSRSL